MSSNVTFIFTNLEKKGETGEKLGSCGTEIDVMKRQDWQPVQSPRVSGRLKHIQPVTVQQAKTILAFF